MKRVLVMIVALVAVVSAAMAEGRVNPFFRKGYTADVQLSSTDINSFHITSSHGYGFGNGLYVGGGAGFGAEWESADVSKAPHYVPSLFVEGRWNILDHKISPFVALRGSQFIDLTEGAARYGVTPKVGLNIGRFSLGIGYSIRTQRENAMQVSVCFTF